MRDIDLYKAILGLTPPWRVVNVELDVKGQDVTVRVDAGEGPFPCPECRTVVPGYDRKRRRWRHLDTCQVTTWIEAEVPRVSSARPTGSGSSRSPGPSQEASSRRSSNGSPSTCSASARSKVGPICSASPGTRRGGSRPGP